jgi:hypothetical protein
MLSVMRSVMLFFLQQPIFFFQLVVQIRSPSLTNLGHLLFAWLASALMIGARGHAMLTKGRIEMLQGIRPWVEKGAIFKKISVTKFLDTSVEHLQHTFPAVVLKTPLVPSYGMSPEKYINIYAVSDRPRRLHLRLFFLAILQRTIIPFLRHIFFSSRKRKELILDCGILYCTNSAIFPPLAQLRRL